MQSPSSSNNGTVPRGQILILSVRSPHRVKPRSARSARSRTHKLPGLRGLHGLRGYLPTDFQKAVLAWLIAGTVALIALLPRVVGTADFFTTDEANYWEERVARFAAALSQADWAATNQTGHPGVTTMWLGTLGRWIALMVPLVTRLLKSSAGGAMPQLRRDGSLRPALRLDERLAELPPRHCYGHSVGSGNACFVDAAAITGLDPAMIGAQAGIADSR